MKCNKSTKRPEFTMFSSAAGFLRIEPRMKILNYPNAGRAIQRVDSIDSAQLHPLCRCGRCFVGRSTGAAPTASRTMRCVS